MSNMFQLKSTVLEVMKIVTFFQCHLATVFQKVVQANTLMLTISLWGAFPADVRAQACQDRVSDDMSLQWDTLLDSVSLCMTEKDAYEILMKE